MRNLHIISFLFTFLFSSNLCFPQEIILKDLNYKALGEKGAKFLGEDNFDSAIYYLEKSSSQINTNIIESPEAVKIKFDYGYTLSRKGELDESNRILKNLISEVDELKADSLLKAKIHRRYMTNLSSQGKFDEAQHIGELGLKYLNRFKEENKEELGLYYQTLGVNYAYLNYYDQAIKFMQMGLDIRRELFGEMDEEVATSYSNLGVIAKWLGDFEKCASFYEKALNLRIKLLGKDHPNLADIYGNLGVLYSDLGQFERALDYHLRAKQIREKNQDTSVTHLGGIYHNISRVYLQMEDYEEALAYSRRSIEYFIQNGLGDFITIVNSYGGLGNCFFEQGAFNQALENYQIAKSICAKQSGGRNLLCLEINILIGQVYKEQGDYKTALNYFNDVIASTSNTVGKNHPIIAKCYIHIGEIYALQGDLDSALKSYHASILANVNGFDNDNLFSVPESLNASSLEYYFEGLIGKIKVIRELVTKSQGQKEAQALLNTLIKADKLVNKMIIEFQRLSDRLQFQKGVADLYRQAVEVSYNLYILFDEESYLEQLNFFIEKSKANAFLLESIKDNKLKTLPDSILSKGRAIRVNQNYYETKILEESFKSKIDSSVYTAFNDRLFTLREEYSGFTEMIRHKYPDYYNTFLNPKVSSISKVQSNLDSDQGVLQYFMSDSTIYLLLIKRHGNLLVKLDSKNGIQEIFKLRNQLSKTVKVGYEELLKTSHYLYKLLIGPIYMEIDALKELIIIPHQELALIPFEVLAVHEKDDTYFIEEWVTSYAPSLTLAFNDQQPPRERNRFDQEIIAFVPSFDYAGVNQMDSKRNSFGDLKWAKAEVSNISSRFETNILLHEAATESSFKSNAANYDVIHLATHALVEDSDPLMSKIIFTKSESDTLNDGYLHTKELFSLDINAEMTVLSACNTGYGKVLRGEGVLSLARGFFYAGAKSVVMSFWPANDRSTSEIMNAFYNHLADGKRKDEALRLAKLEYLEKAKGFEAHPYYWAGFVANGDMRPIFYDSSAKMYLLFLIPLIVLLMIAKSRRKKLRALKRRGME